MNPLGDLNQYIRNKSNTNSNNQSIQPVRYQQQPFFQPHQQQTFFQPQQQQTFFQPQQQQTFFQPPPPPPPQPQYNNPRRQYVDLTGNNNRGNSFGAIDLTGNNNRGNTFGGIDLTNPNGFGGIDLTNPNGFGGINVTNNNVRQQQPLFQPARQPVQQFMPTNGAINIDSDNRPILPDLCPFCQKPINNGTEVVRTTFCNHYLHRSCISGRCPSCNLQLNPVTDYRSVGINPGLARGGRIYKKKKTNKSIKKYKTVVKRRRNGKSNKK